jgi:Uma2 family endonuclease
MSTILPNLPQPPVSLSSTAAATTPTCRADVVVSEKITVPGWINTLDEFLRWAESDEYPQSGWISYLNGSIWVDPSMEEFLSHNQVKQAFNGMFSVFFTTNKTGRFVPDRMLYANIAANLSTEPDGMFYLWATMKSGRFRMVPGKTVQCAQLEGTPDGVLEVVSAGSVTKDLVHLRDLYWKAQIPEFWLVDAQSDEIQFDILRHAKDGYQPSLVDQGWVRSDVLAHWFRIERTTDILGFADYFVHVRA